MAEKITLSFNTTYSGTSPMDYEAFNRVVLNSMCRILETVPSEPMKPAFRIQVSSDKILRLYDGLIQSGFTFSPNDSEILQHIHEQYSVFREIEMILTVSGMGQSVAPKSKASV